MSGKVPYLHVITMIRGLAALAVCAAHLVSGKYIDNQWLVELFDLGGYGVQAFFIISGVVLPLSMLNGGYTWSAWKIFLLKRSLRIEPAYLATLVLSVIYIALSSKLMGNVVFSEVVDLKGVLLHAAYLVPFFEGEKWLNGVFWTLAIEFQYYLFLMLLMPILFSKRVILRSAVYLFLLLAPFTMNDRAFFLYWSSLFLMGIIYLLYRAEKVPVIEFLLVSGLAILVTFINTGAVSGLVAFLTLFCIHVFAGRRHKYLEWLGNISYSLYLTHTITGVALVHFLSKFSALDPYRWVVLIVALLFSIICAKVMFILVEKPSQIMAARLKYKNKEIDLNVTPVGSSVDG